MKIFWKSYAVLFFLIALSNALSFLNETSVARLYYGAMISFSPLYFIYFAFNVLNIFLALITSFIVILYALDIKHPSPLWRWLFFFRLVSEVWGHHYEWKYIQSILTHEAYYGYVTIACIFIPLLPSYLAHFRYAFNLQKRK